MDGKLLKDIRYIAGISQAELAEYLQVTQSAVGHFETGRKAVPKRIQLKIEMLLTALGTSPEEMVFLTDLKKKGKGYHATIKTD